MCSGVAKQLADYNAIQPLAEVCSLHCVSL